MFSSSLPLLVAITLIFISVMALAAYTIKQFANTPARVAGVIVALTGLIAAMPPVIRALGDTGPGGSTGADTSTVKTSASPTPGRVPRAAASATGTAGDTSAKPLVGSVEVK